MQAKNYIRILDDGDDGNNGVSNDNRSDFANDKADRIIAMR